MQRAVHTGEGREEAWAAVSACRHVEVLRFGQGIPIKVGNGPPPEVFEVRAGYEGHNPSVGQSVLTVALLWKTGPERYALQ